MPVECGLHNSPEMALSCLVKLIKKVQDSLSPCQKGGKIRPIMMIDSNWPLC